MITNNLYEAKLSGLTVQRKIVFEKLLEEARCIKKSFEQKFQKLIQLIDQSTYSIVWDLQNDFINSTEETRSNLYDNFIKIFSSHELELGKDSQTKLSNTNKMLNEINKLQDFQYSIDETEKSIEQEFDTIKEILEQKIYNSYSEIIQESELFSQFKIVDESIRDSIG